MNFYQYLSRVNVICVVCNRDRSGNPFFSEKRLGTYSPTRVVGFTSARELPKYFTIKTSQNLRGFYYLMLIKECSLTRFYFL